jgi:mannose PTS system EIIC component
VLIQAILLGIWAGLCMIDGKGLHLGFQKPLLAGAGAAVITGDIVTGLIIAATLELLWLGTNNVGAYTPPDIIAGSVVGVAIGVLSGGGVAAGVAVAVPAAVLVQQLNVLAYTANISLAHRADTFVEKGDLDSKTIGYLQFTGALFMFLSRAVPVFIAIYLGATAVNKVLEFIPESVINGISVAAGLLPAVGFAMLLRLMIRKNSWVFLIIGFTLVSYLNIPTIGVALIGIVIAYFYDLITNLTNNASTNDDKASSQPIEEGGYDL